MDSLVFRYDAADSSISEDKSDDGDVNIVFSDLDELQHISRVCLRYVRYILIEMVKHDGE